VVGAWSAHAAGGPRDPPGEQSGGTAMHSFSLTYDDISNVEPEHGRHGADIYQGRHVRLDAYAEVAADVRGSHPRRRGFGILSRLARVEAVPDADSVADAAFPGGTHLALADA
jgi:hypothetical protein